MFWEVLVRVNHQRLGLVLFLLAWFSLLPATVQAAGSEGVATLVQLSGEVTCRPATGTWYAAWPELRSRLFDHVRTGPGSVATLEFDVGGRVGINQDSGIQIVGERQVETVGQEGFRRILLKAGGDLGPSDPTAQRAAGADFRGRDGHQRH